MMNSQNCKHLVQDLLSKRAGPFSPLTKLFSPHLDKLRKLTGVGPNGKIDEIIFNALNEIVGRGKCLVCGGETRLYPQRGGWSDYCSKKCMNDSSAPRRLNAEKTKIKRGTGIGSKKTRDKSKRTMLSRYGVDNPSLVPEFQKKREQTFIERFDANTPWKNDDVKKKTLVTMKERYGGTGNQSKILSPKISKTRRIRTISDIQSKLTDWTVLTNADEWKGSHAQPLLLQHSCGTQVEDYVWCGQNLFDPRCPKCHTSSRPQRKLISLIESLGFNPIVNDRRLIKPLELDVVVPDKKLAIEVNGLYYHGELAGKSRNYHLHKTELVENLGYQLIHITDGDVINRWSAVETMVKSKLGVLPKIYARKTDLKEICDKREVDEFLNTYHLQGSCRYSIALGLYSEEKLVAVATFGKSRFDKTVDYELLRFCSNASVIGGASKLIKAFTEGNPGTLISYADRRWSTGNLYNKIGFKNLGNTKPGYWYFRDYQLVHRTLFQKHKISTPETQHLTEWEIMQISGWDRYWDCGHTKFILGKSNV